MEVGREAAELFTLEALQVVSFPIDASFVSSPTTRAGAKAASLIFSEVELLKVCSTAETAPLAFCITA